MFTLDPKETTVVFGGARIEGWADGTFIEVTYKADMYTLAMGADGLGARMKSNDRSATITFRLMKNSPSNIVLQAFHAADIVSNLGSVPLTFKNEATKPPTGGTAAEAWIMKDPGDRHSKDSPDPVEWVLETDNLVMVHGGDV